MKFIQSIKTKLMKPKVYALVLEGGSYSFLSLQSAYSLEEAFGFAKEEWKSQNPDKTNIEMRIRLFTHAELEKLFGKFITTEIKESGDTDPKADSSPENKAVLMKKIVDTQDKELLRASKNILSEAEFKYLSSRLNKK
jgi:hypothetical protein